ncbi:MAG: hypothetical protein GX162_00005 [Firmicutes bacterium]|nr:hypothetical protein [Bacillota bacterium]
MCRKVFVFVLLAALLMVSQSVFAESITAFGNIGLGHMKWAIEGDDGETTWTESESSPAVAIQAGLVYELPVGFGIGGIFDRVDMKLGYSYHQEWNGVKNDNDEEDRVLLNGYGAIVTYRLPTSEVDCEVFAGAVRYTFTKTYTYNPGGFIRKVERDPAIGFIGGANVKTPVWNSLYLTGAFAYRSVSFGEGTITEKWSADVFAPTNGYTTEPPIQVTSWSLTAGIAYKF